MMYSYALILAFVVAAGSPLTAQSVADYAQDPATLAEAFARGRARPQEDALTGEAADNPVSLAKFPAGARISAREHWRGDGRALVGVTFATGTDEGDDAGRDLYVFLDSLPDAEPGPWRISAFRVWDLPRGTRQQLNRYRNKSEPMLRREYEAKFRESAERGVTRAQHDAVHGGVEQHVFGVYNLRLANSTDAGLARHLEFLRKRFDALRADVESRPASPLAIEHDDADLGEALRYLLIRRAHHPADGPLRLEVASLGGDDVGYLYCDSPDCIPTPTPGGVVALVDLGGGWWLYRTV